MPFADTILLLSLSQHSLVRNEGLLLEKYCTDGSKALALADSYQPDLILLDLILPDLNGETVIRCLKQNSTTTQIPIITTTGLARTADQEYFLKLGCTHYLSKPYIIDELERILCLYLNFNGAEQRVQSSL